MKFTVLGASGFVGSHLVAHLQDMDIECFAPARDDVSIFERNLGHVIYCIGLTADFRARLFDTVRAHVCQLPGILERAEFDSFLYLSSTRLYAKSDSGKEEAVLMANPTEQDDLYNLSKMMGESLCLNSGRQNVRVARLSNVYGSSFSSSSFLDSIVRDAVARKKITLSTSPQSEKDYVYIRDVISILPQIAMRGRHSLYNVAAGDNIDNHSLTDKLLKLTGCDVDFQNDAKKVSYPRISIERIKGEFSYSPVKIDDMLGDLIAEYKSLNSAHQRSGQ